MVLTKEIDHQTCLNLIMWCVQQFQDENLSCIEAVNLDRETGDSETCDSSRANPRSQPK